MIQKYALCVLRFALVYICLLRKKKPILQAYSLQFWECSYCLTALASIAMLVWQVLSCNHSVVRVNDLKELPETISTPNIQ